MTSKNSVLRRRMESLALLMFAILCELATFGQTGTISLDLAPGMERIAKLDHNGSYNIAVDYTTSVIDNYTLKAESDSGYSFTGKVDTVSKKGTITIASSDLKENYGTHVVSVKIELSSGVTSEVREIVIFYEEPITDFKVQYPSYVQVGSSVRFLIKMSLGSNIDLEFMKNGKPSVTSYSGKVRKEAIYHSFPTATTNDIITVASNDISRALLKQTVISIYNVQGFWLDHNQGPWETTENVYFTLYLNPTMNLTMGPLTLKVSFGDGKQDDWDITGSIDALRNGTNFVISHQYDRQGKYIVTSEIKGQINTLTLETKTVFVWNNLAKATLSSSIVYAKVNEPVVFSFPDHPSQGFLYKVSYGDGDENENNETSLFTLFNDPKLEHKYTSPGVYHVAMSAWNPFYVSRKHLTITVQYPIPESSINLRPSRDVIPIPGAHKRYTMELTRSDPSPTNVTCDFFSGEKWEKNVETEIIQNVPIVKDYDYKFAGTKNVKFSCRNLVSSMTKTAVLSVKGFKSSDFKFHYQKIVNMNMTRIDSGSGGTPSFASDNVTVDFRVSLFEVTHLPPNVTITWDYDDGSPDDTFILSSFFYNHTFADRGTYTMKINVSRENDYYIHVHTIQLGIVQFWMKSYKGVINITDFEFIANGIGPGAEYTFNTDYDNYELKDTASVNEARQNFVYSRVGSYYPMVVGTNATVYEKVYLHSTLFVDWSIKGISVAYSNTTIPLPPGNLTLNVSMPALSETDTLLTCTINYGDDIDKNIYTFHQNFTVDTPFVYEYSYLTLGTHRVYIKCFNLIETFENYTYVHLVNPCFVERGIYDRQYSSPFTPMRLYTSVDTDLSSRMPVRCFWLDPHYFWEIHRYINGEELKMDYKWYTIPSGTFRFWKGTIEPGTYKVSLKVQLTETWCYEYTYVRFERSPPFSKIAVGNRRYVKRSIVEVNAKEQSYNPDQGPGDNADLTFTWFCYRYNATHTKGLDIEKLFQSRGGIPYFINNTNYIGNDTIPNDPLCEDSITDKSPGVVLLNATDSLFDHYIFVVEVGLKYADSSYDYQIISIVDGTPPSVKFECLINCRNKIAVGELLIWKASCGDCQESDYIEYLWTLTEYNPSTKRYEEIKGLEAKSVTGVTHEQLGLKHGSLKAGTLYKLYAHIKVEGREDVGKGEVLLETNALPFGGSCYIDPTIGNATTTIFKVNCPGWKDEGSGKSWDDSKNSKEPLTYRYILEIPRTINGYEVVEKIPIFVAGESSLSELMLPVGEEKFNFNMTVVVEICDIYGDCLINKNSSVSVAPDDNLMINDTDGGMSNFLNTYNITLNELQAGGNIIAVMRYVGAAASLFSDVNVTEAGGEYKAVLLKKNNEFLRLFYEAISDDRSNNTKDRMNAGDSSNIVQNVLVAMRNKDLLDDNSTDYVVKIAQILTRNMNDRTISSLFPVEDLEFMSQISSSSLFIVDSALNTLFPDEIVDLSDELSREDVEDELRGNRTFETVEEEDAFKLEVDEEMAKRQAKRDKMKSKVEHAEHNVPSMIDAIESMQGMSGSKMVTDEDEYSVEKPNVRITVEKTTLQTFLNRTEIDKKDFRLQFSNDTNVTGEVALRTAVFKKIPYFYGKGAKNLTSKGVMVSVLNGTKKENISLTLKLKNEATASFKKYQPEYIPGDTTNRLYFKCNLPDTNDAMLLYIKPNDFDPNDYDSFGLYDVSVTVPAYKWSTNHKFNHPLEIRDWVNSDLGLKVFVPQGLFPAGELFVVLKPVEPKALPDIPEGYRRRLLSVNTTTEENTTPYAANESSTTPSVFESQEANVSLIILTTGCRTWKEETKEWTASGCEVLDFSDLNDTVCRCPQPEGQMFATTFYVPPNTIDFTGVWAKFDWNNAAVYGTCIAILCVYALLCLWARRQDPKDRKRWTTRFLCDSDKDDVYFYLLTVYTGMRKDAGSRSSFNFVVSGDEGDTDVRILSDGITQGFQVGSNRKFIMGTREPLGELVHLRIWQDCRGEGSSESWFLDQIIIDDAQTCDRYVFVCNNWISSARADGLCERELSVTDKGNMNNFQNRFSQEARFSITENHLWLSLVLRPHRSNFNRVQRMSCVLALLFLTMITNAMFFNTSSGEAEADTITLGTLKFSLKTFYVSFVSILITTPPILLMVYLFKNSKLKVVTKQKDEHTVEQTLRRRVDCTLSYHCNAKQNMELVDSELYSQDHLPLPHWTLYVAWLLILLSVVASCFFLILYSMEWGKETSTEWISSFVFSFFESLFVVDPVKVIAVAVLVALCFKKPAGEGAPSMKLHSVRQLVQRFNAGPLRSYLTFRRTVLSEHTSPSTEEIQKVKRRRQQEMRANEALMEIIVYIIFIFVIYSLGYINRDERSFLLKDNLERSLYTNRTYQFGFQGVRSYEDYMFWLRETLFIRYFPEKDYTGQKLGVRDRMFFYDLDNARIGPARLRQVRMYKEECPYSKLNRPRYCVPSYEEEKEETDNFCVGWQPFNKSCATNRFLYSEDAWVFKTPKEIWGISMMGDFSSYGGGGYILQLDISLENSINILNELERYKWIDRRTRAVFVEFTVYNANSNLFAYVVFLCEFTPLGGLTTWTDIRAFRPYQHTGAMGAFAILCYFIYSILLIVNTLKCFHKIRKQGFGFLSHPWQIVDLLCAIISYVAIAFWTLRYIYARQSMAVYYDDKKTFINFQHIVVWDYVFSAILGILIFIATIRILKILGYNRRMTELSDVISHAAKDLGGFFFCFGFVFFSFVSLGHLIFGAYIKKYRSIFSTVGSLSNALIGKNSLDSLIKAAPQVAQFYYFMYVLFVILMLMTMFAAILNQSITDVRAEIYNEPETYGIVNVITNSAKDILGTFVNFNKKSDNTSDVKDRKSNFLQPDEGGFNTPNILKLVRESFGPKWESEENTPPLPLDKKNLQAMEAVAMLDIVFTVPTPSDDGFFDSAMETKSGCPSSYGFEYCAGRSVTPKTEIDDSNEDSANNSDAGHGRVYMPYL